MFNLFCPRTKTTGIFLYPFEFKLARTVIQYGKNKYKIYLVIWIICFIFVETKTINYGNNILDIKYVYGITLWLFFLTRTKRQEDINITNCSFLFVVYLWNGYVCLNPVLATKIITWVTKQKKWKYQQQKNIIQK